MVGGGRLRSGLCTQRQLESDTFRGWASRMHVDFHLYRKLWEWCFIAQALDERGRLQPGKRGLGFGVGQEPLTALFAAQGCEVVATDMALTEAQSAGWIKTDEHAASLQALNQNGLCDPETFEKRCSFRVADMNAIPNDLRDFDFTWSSCCFEHLGSIDLGLEFVERQLRCLKPGGVAVHTTEFNLSSDEETLTDGPCVIFRRRDIDRLVRSLHAQGHAIDVDFDAGDGLADAHVDVPPYHFNPHLKLQLAGYVTTSLGLIVEKSRREEKGLLHAISRTFRRRSAV